MKSKKTRLQASLLAILLIAVLAMTVTVSAAENPDWAASGNGTESDPYIISTYAQLNAFAAYVNNYHNCSDVYIKLSDSFEAEGSLNTSIASNHNHSGFYRYESVPN